LRDDLGVKGGAAGGYPAQRLDELTDVGDPVLEQVPDTRATAAGRRGGEELATETSAESGSISPSGPRVDRSRYGEMLPS